MKKKNLNNSQLTIIIVAIIAISFAAVMFSFTPSFAQKAKRAKNDITTKNVYKYKTVIIDSSGKRTENEEVSEKPIKGQPMVDKNDVAAEDGNHVDRMVIVKNQSNAFYNEGQITALDLDVSGMLESLNKQLADLEIKLSNAKLTKETEAEVTEELEKNIAGLKKQTEKIKEHKRVVMMRTRDHEDAMINGEFPDFDEMLKLMEKEALIKRSEDYVLTNTKDGLTINGVKQPASVYDKYLPWLDNKNITIKGHNKKIDYKALGPKSIDGMWDGKVTKQERFRIIELMGKEGLLDPSECSISKKNGDLYINDVKQPNTILEKFGMYFEENSQMKVTAKDPYKQ